MNNLSTETWRFEVGLACWDFRVRIAQAVSINTQILITRNLAKLMDIVSPFAVVSALSVTTASQGENALEIGKEDVANVQERLAACDDIEEIEVSLDLKCTGLDGVEVLVRESASVWLQLEPDATERPLRLLFALDVDLYFPLTRGEITDNQALARLNYHKLNDFIDDVQQKMLSDLVNVDAPDYKGLIDESGFVLGALT